MNDLFNDCDLNVDSNELEILLRQIKKQIKDLTNTTTAKLLMQDGKIAETCVYIKENLSNEIRSLLDTMESNGELDSIITNAINLVLGDLQDQINNNVIYFGKEIYTEKFHDNASNTDYYVTHIPKTDSKNNTIKLKVGIANDNKNMDTLESTLDFAHRKNATLVVNAGFYNLNTNAPIGSVISDGKIIKRDIPGNSKYNYACINSDGNLVIYPYNTDPQTMINLGVKEAICGTTILVSNGSYIELSDTTKEPRQAIGQKVNGEIIILTTDGRSREDEGMSFNDLSRILVSLGVNKAINLDGGGSTSTVLRGIKQNDNIDDLSEDRKVSNFLYITKNVTEDENQILNECFKEIGKLKQYTLNKFANLIDMEEGFIRLRGKKGFHFPGIEAYTNGSNERIGKIGYQDREDVLRSVYATLTNTDGIEETVFRATRHGLYNYNGMMANFLAFPRRVPNNDCNILGVPTSIYYMFEDDVNSPKNGIGACLLLHMPFNENLSINIRQIAIPLNEQKSIKMRGCNSTGVWGEWCEMGVAKGNTSQRPTGAKAGLMYWDTSLAKPIWYTGAIWVDATGTQV